MFCLQWLLLLSLVLMPLPAASKPPRFPMAKAPPGGTAKAPLVELRRLLPATTHERTEEQSFF